MFDDINKKTTVDKNTVNYLKFLVKKTGRANHQRVMDSRRYRLNFTGFMNKGFQQVYRPVDVGF